MLDTARPYWVYVLYSGEADRFYTGVSEDVEERVRRHNAGQSRWTARHWKACRDWSPDLQGVEQPEGGEGSRRGGNAAETVSEPLVAASPWRRPMSGGTPP
ncbi:MAG: hypothetical protein FJX75_08325 [Armatimonadetes bacterium]|nr:hypothetical protein [Armatimonadota bacterium]